MAKPNAYATPSGLGRKSGTCHARHSRTDSVWKTKCSTRGQYVYHFSLSPLQGIETYAYSMLQIYVFKDDREAPTPSAIQQGHDIGKKAGV
jgi:hypothetical protein